MECKQKKYNSLCTVIVLFMVLSYIVELNQFVELTLQIYWKLLKYLGSWCFIKSANKFYIVKTKL